MSTSYKLQAPEEQVNVPVINYLKNKICSYIAITILQAPEGSGVQQIANNITDGILAILQETEQKLQGSSTNESIPQ